jgi:hypothetical protein
MTVQLIAHPFRLAADGRVQTHEQDSEEYLAERLALLLSCRPGERILVPNFGINDPAYGGLTLAAIQNQVNIYEIPVTVTDVKRDPITDGLTRFRVTFTRNEETSE